MSLKNIFTSVLLLLLPFVGFATHLRAGEITAKRISTTDLTYRVTLTTYTDEINGKQANDAQDNVDFYFGITSTKIESFSVARKKKILLSASTVCNVYDTVFTFPAAGRYTISCGIKNRNANTVNLPGTTSDLSFFVRTTLIINSSLGQNSTPILLNVPIDSAAVGQKFIHNPGAYDPDGDSLAYRLAIPLQNSTLLPGDGSEITGYQDPTLLGTAPILNELGTGPATFSINSSTGDLVWDVPRLKGQYNVAFIVEEWRKAPDGSMIKIGEVERDMQIIVVVTNNHKPKLVVPADVCVDAGNKVNFEVSASDLDAQMLTLSTSGGVYNLNSSGGFFKFIEPEAATFSSTKAISNVKGIFNWNTNCLHARDQAYDVLFKVVDTPPRFDTQLADIKTIKIKVLPPRIVGLNAKQQTDGSMLVTWTAIKTCGTNAKILIYRKNGCSGINPSNCTQGIPVAWGYTLIGTVAGTDSIYIDKTTQTGGVYSYRMIMQMPVSQFVSMQSVASAEFCVGNTTKAGMSMLTNISILKTDAANGSIDIHWTRPLNIIQANNLPPFVYKLYRADGLTNENYTLIQTIETDLVNPSDTLFVDQSLNTLNLVYKYKLEFYTESTKLFGTAATASTLRATANGNDKQISVNWAASVPWNNNNHTHFIYREDQNNPGSFNLIKRLVVTDATSFSYKDLGQDTEPADGNISKTLVNGVTECYKIVSIGNYDKINYLDSLVNYSQIVCAKAVSNITPCVPDASMTISGTKTCESLSPKDLCLENTFVNKISWQNPATATGQACSQDIAAYKIYYGRYEADKPTLLATQAATLPTTYSHQKNSIDGFAGCYYISAVNSFGTEGSQTSKICFDNCEKIAFPNVFTPNGDGLNDTFSPMNCPAFVNNINYEIYNTAGLKIDSGSGSSLNWNGTSSNGAEMPSGQYYYLVKVNFERLAKTGSVQTYKGWINLIR